jgi:hypothetical protein
MRRILLALTTTSLLVSAAPAAAQESCRVLCRPVFVAQPGLVVSNAFNAPELAAGVRPNSNTDFLFRVTTVIPTEIPRTTLVGIVQWTPFATVRLTPTAPEYTANAPAFVYGPVFTLFQAGPLTTTFDVLGLYAPSPHPNSDYKHQLLLEFDVGLSLGSMMGPTAPPLLRSLSLYGFVAQSMTDVGRDFRNDRVYSPLLLFGVTIPIAPLP